ncbi:MAG TPA: DUF2970 domain-containing protein [Burkholderiales bacterium]|jgi:hypothetical protein|nr:DUF2970 domain-containing protein [Burkholderiales bacterium]
MAANDDRGARKATPLRVAKAVFWSFFGVRKESDLDRDAVTIRPVQIIIGGLLGAALLVGVLIGLAHFATR